MLVPMAAHGLVAVPIWERFRISVVPTPVMAEMGVQTEQQRAGILEQTDTEMARRTRRRQRRVRPYQSARPRNNSTQSQTLPAFYPGYQEADVGTTVGLEMGQEQDAATTSTSTSPIPWKNISTAEE